jgi:hypothetical protein
MPIFLAILKKVLIFLAPIIINWIWEKKIMKKQKGSKDIDKSKIVEGKILR